MNYEAILDAMLTHVKTIDEEIGKRHTELIQTEVDTLCSLIIDTQQKQWIESILELK
tara:strand:- start:12526 stop:12696 length:171 start_codon:yes stop_codon:yes gene_type:complete